jgi:hypothetical protein
MIVMEKGRMLEEGTTREVFSAPQHDSTARLLDAHSKEIPATFHASLRWSWVHWRHVPGLLNNALSARWARGSVNRSRVAPRLGAYGGGVSRWAYLVRYFHQVAVLMRRLDERGIEPDWKAL